MSLSHQVAILYATGQGHVDDVPIERVKAFEREFLTFAEGRYDDVLREIEQSKDLSDAAKAKLDAAVREFKSQFPGGSEARGQRPDVREEKATAGAR
jgi:F-type H+-transporting ATPase subunit alpha